jgi:hypothetical protein
MGRRGRMVRVVGRVLGNHMRLLLSKKVWEIARLLGGGGEFGSERFGSEGGRVVGNPLGPIARRRRIEKPRDSRGVRNMGVRNLEEERRGDGINYHGGRQAVFGIDAASSVVQQVFLDVVLGVVGVVGRKGAFHSGIVVHVIVCVDVVGICGMIGIRVGITVRMVREVRVFCAVGWALGRLDWTLVSLLCLQAFLHIRGFRGKHIGVLHQKHFFVLKCVDLVSYSLTILWVLGNRYLKCHNHFVQTLYLAVRPAWYPILSTDLL